jgi:hypothetical protein
VDIFCWIKAIGFAPKAGFVICLNNILLSKLNIQRCFENRSFKFAVNLGKYWEMKERIVRLV